MIEVREALPGDEQALAEVSRLATATLRETYRLRDPAPAERPSTSAERPSAAGERRRFAALLDGRIVGVVRCEDRGVALHLIGLGVHPDFRKQGVATALTDHLAGEARAASKRFLTLNTVKETGNVAAFEKMGFRVGFEKVADDIVSDHLGRLTDVYMVRPPG